MSARDELFRRVAGAFIDEAKANRLLDAYRAEVLREVADELEAIDFHPNAGGNFLGVCRQLATRFRRKANESFSVEDGAWKPWGGHDRYCAYVGGTGKCSCPETPEGGAR